jgi:excisionase family DNA binding protein
MEAQMPNQTEILPRYITEKQVAQLTGLALSTIRHHRFERRGIPFVKVGRAVRYSIDDVLRFMEGNKVQTEPK